MIIYYDHENQFELTNEEFKNALPAFEAGKNVWVERLRVHLTPFYKWAGQKPESKKELTKGYTHDGMYVEKRFGQWIDPSNPSAIIDYKYYPELIKDEVHKENPLFLPTNTKFR